MMQPRLLSDRQVYWLWGPTVSCEPLLSPVTLFTSSTCADALSVQWEVGCLSFVFNDPQLL